jgi:beta-lactamase regulating signal transducer with metallopeptidase domain
MSELFVLRALVFAGGCFAAATLIFALAWCATRPVARAGLRHTLWLAAFAAALLVPLAALVVPAGMVFERRVAVEVPAYVEVAPAAAPVVHEASVAPSLPKLDARDIAIALFVLWSLGALWTLSRLALGSVALSSLRRRSKPHALSPADLPKLQTRGRECELRLAAGEDGPITWGVIRPVILLPHSAATWPRARLQAVLLHELAHVRRRDSLTQLLAFIVCALHWPNPLAWIAARALRREAEIAADDQVIVSGVKPSAYAGELLSLAGEFRGRRGLAVAMAGQSALEARVKSALAPNPSRSGVSPMDILKVVSLGVAVTALLAFARPDVVDAQDVSQKTLPAVDMTAPADPAVEPAPAAEPAIVDDESDATVAPAPGDIVVHETRDRHGRKVQKIVRIGHVDHQQIEAAMEQARQAEAEIAKIQPEIDRAIAAAKIDEKTARALEKIEPQIRAEVARAIAKARPAIRQTMAQVRISQEAVEAAARAHERAVVRIEKHDEDSMDKDDEADNDADNDSDDDADDHDEGSPDHE